MSSSPSICASPNFTFPAGKNELTQDYFGKMTKEMENKPMENMDYFNHSGAAGSGAGSGSVSGPRLHRGMNDSISSLTSNTSDLTFRDSISMGVRKPSRTHSLMSTDTLVDDVASVGSSGCSSSNMRNRNKLKLSLHAPSYSHNQTLKGVNDPSGYVFSEADEPKASSAIEPSFNFDGTSTADTSMEPHYYELETQYERDEHGFKAPALRRHPTDMSFDQVISFNNIPKDPLKPMVYSKTKQEENYRNNIESLSSQIRYIDLDQAEFYINNTECYNKLPNLLIIDVRPFTDYVKSHIKDSINVCLPSTLLKRTNFNLTRCIKSLPLYEKLLFNNYLKAHECNKTNNIERSSTVPCGKYGLPAVMLYDNLNNSSNIFHFCKKFLNGPTWDKSSPIFLLNSSFHEFEKRFPQHVECGKSEKLNIAELNANLNEQLSPVMEENLKLRSSSLTEIPSYIMSSDSVIDSGLPSLSNFILPSSTGSVFKIRHNEEVLTSIDFSNSTIQLENDFRRDSVPNWMKSTLMDEQRLNKEFMKLEKLEQRRLVGALSIKANIQDVPKISGGIEYGHKNRYKDILVYEHSRVKLAHSSEEEPDDYINASYLNLPPELSDLTNLTEELKPHLRYIAAQGPLDTTIGDMWKCVLMHKTTMVISLTNETENGVKKCSPFWLPGEYVANKDRIRVYVSDEFQYSQSIVIRTFEISMNDEHFHRAIQVHLLSWPDMGSVLEMSDLLDIIMLKHFITEAFSFVNSSYPCLIHCSAGCGRTGVLCAADTVLNILMYNGSKELPYDPVFFIIEHLRRQRISMVQNLRQYYLVYDIILKYLNDWEFGSMSPLCHANIVRNFISNHR